jgi:signaling intermediate in Toll pathway protein
MRDKKYVGPVTPAEEKGLMKQKPAPPVAPEPVEQELPPTITRKAALYEKLEGIPRETNDLDRWAYRPRDDIEPRDIISAERNWFNDEEKDKETFLDKVEQFSHTVEKRRHGQVEFIYAAIRIMKDYGVHKDLQAYKALMDVFPKEYMTPKNIFQIMFWHFNKQQDCAVDILHAMELNGVEPDHEMEELVIDIFSKNSLPWRKVARQLYWFSKVRNANPFPLPEGDISNRDVIELAKMALRRMCPDIQTRISVYSTSQIEDSADKTWIVSAQSPSQKELIEEISPDQPLYVEGAFRVWLKDQQLLFHYLRADNRDKVNPMQPEDKDPLDVTNIPFHLYGSSQSADNVLMTQKGIHKQADGTILAICATGTSSRDSLLSWIRILQTSNPKMDHLNVIFTLKAPPVDLEPVNQLRENA